MTTRYPVSAIRSVFVDQGVMLGVPVASVVLCSGNVRNAVDTPQNLRYGGPDWCPMTADGIVEEVEFHDLLADWVVIEGPSAGSTDLNPLVDALHDSGYMVALRVGGRAHGAVETDADWLTVIYAQGVYPELITGANEIIHFIRSPSDISDIEETVFMNQMRDDVIICVEPLNSSVMVETVRACSTYNWRLALHDPRLNK